MTNPTSEPTPPRRRLRRPGVLTTGGALSVLAGVVLLVVAAVHAPAAEPEPEPDATARTELEVLEFRVGDCFDHHQIFEDGVAGGMTMLPARAVLCAEPHQFEVYHDFAIADESDEYPGAIEIDQQAEEGCLVAFRRFVGVEYEVSRSEFFYLSPSGPVGWRQGARSVTCIVFRPGELTTGTLWNSGPSDGTAEQA